MKDKNNEILKDVENTDGGKNVGPLYTKIKFDAILSDYQLNMILKIIEYAKGFVLSADDLKNIGRNIIFRYLWNRCHTFFC